MRSCDRAFTKTVRTGLGWDWGGVTFIYYFLCKNAKVLQNMLLLHCIQFCVSISISKINLVMNLLLVLLLYTDVYVVVLLMLLLLLLFLLFLPFQFLVAKILMDTRPPPPRPLFLRRRVSSFAGLRLFNLQYSSRIPSQSGDIIPYICNAT